MSKKRKLTVVAAVTLLGAILLFVPVTSQRVFTTGTDAFEAHHALYGKRIKFQDIALQGKLTGVAAILVNLRRSPELAPVHITLRSTDGAFLAEQRIDPSTIKDDTFSWTQFDNLRIPGDQVRIEFSGPEATKEAAIGLRFELDHPDRLALAVKERVPLWKAITQFVTRLAAEEDLGPAILWALVATLLLAIILLVPQLPFPSRFQFSVYASFLLIIFFLTIAVRIDVLRELKGVSGGDAYNYLSITKQITELKNPFAVDKRLPGWPLLMAPAYLTGIDDIWWMRFLSVLSAGGIVVVLSLLARTLKLPWSVQIAAPALLAFQKDFFLTSLRPEPYTFYALLLLLALLLFQYLDRKWVQVVFGIMLGYAAMTRQEGFVLAAVLGLSAIPLGKKLWWQGYMRIGIPAFLLVLPFFIHNTVTFGNPIFTPYFEGGRNQIVDSWNAFKDSARATWQVLGSLWWRVWSQEIYVPFTNIFFLMGSILTLAWFAVARAGGRKQHRGKPLRTAFLIIAGVPLIVTLLVVVVRSVSQDDRSLLQFSDAVMKLSAGVMVASVIPFLAITRWRGLPIVLVLMTQVLIALWFHPLPKHYQQDYPIIALMLATALLAPVSWMQEEMTQKRLTRRVPAVGGSLLHFAFLAPFIITTFILLRNLWLITDRMNQNTAEDYIIYQAIQAAKQRPGPHGFDRPYQASYLYFSTDVFYYGGDRSIEKQKAWLSELNIRTLVLTNLEPLELIPMETWREVAHFRSEGKREKMMESWVYEIPQSDQRS